MPSQPPAWDPDPGAPIDFIGTAGIDLVIAKDVVDAIADAEARYTLEILIESGIVLLIAGDAADPDHSANRVSTGASRDEIRTGVGNDLVYAGDGGDFVSAGPGDDLVFGDDLFGPAGDDSLRGGAGNDRLFGLGGNDDVRGGGGDDEIFGGDGNDQLFGGDGNDRIQGDAGDDLVYGRAGNDEIDGGAGNDILHGNAGQDVIHAGDGDDVVDGGWGRDTIDGGAGNDTLFGRKGADTLCGGSDDDRIHAGTGGDAVYGDQGPAVAGDPPAETADDGNDTLCGLGGSDTLWGQGGDDILDGGKHDDTLDGGSGRDILIGGDGNDALWGGADADTFVFNFSDASSGPDRDIIFDWGEGDILELRGGPPFGILRVAYVAFADEASQDPDGSFRLDDVVLSLSNGGLIQILNAGDDWGYVAGGPLSYTAAIGEVLDLSIVGPGVADNLRTALAEFSRPWVNPYDGLAPDQPLNPDDDPLS